MLNEYLQQRALDLSTHKHTPAEIENVIMNEAKRFVRSKEQLIRCVRNIISKKNQGFRPNKKSKAILPYNLRRRVMDLYNEPLSPSEIVGIFKAEENINVDISCIETTVR